MRTAVALAAAATVVGLAAVPAAAAPAYVGTWGIDAEMCAKPQDVMGAPVVLEAKRFDQHESHCTFGKVTSKKLRGKGTQWSTQAACSIEGDVQNDSLVLRVHRGTLYMSWGGSNAQAYQRCGS